jgi:hypothetical protein
MKKYKSLEEFFDDKSEDNLKQIWILSLACRKRLNGKHQTIPKKAKRI